jgi:hypothetical protein
MYGTLAATWYLAPGSKSDSLRSGRRRDALVLAAQVPPGLVVFVGRNFAGEDLPAPLIDHQSERQEGDLLEGFVQQQADVLGGIGRFVEQSELHQIIGRDGERDGVADGLMEAVIGAVAEEKGCWL